MDLTSPWAVRFTLLERQVLIRDGNRCQICAGKLVTKGPGEGLGFRVEKIVNTPKRSIWMEFNMRSVHDRCYAQRNTSKLSRGDMSCLVNNIRRTGDYSREEAEVIAGDFVRKHMPHITITPNILGYLSQVERVERMEAGSKGKVNTKKSKKVTNQQRLARMIKRDGFYCQLCGKEFLKIAWQLPPEHPERITLDHIIPVSFGGTRVFHNCRAVHMCCNSSRGNVFRYPEDLLAYSRNLYLIYNKESRNAQVKSLPRQAGNGTGGQLYAGSRQATLFIPEGYPGCGFQGSIPGWNGGGSDSVHARGERVSEGCASDLVESMGGRLVPEAGTGESFSVVRRLWRQLRGGSIAG